MSQNPWIIHDSSSQNYFKDPIAKIDFAILNGATPSWPQLVIIMAIELKLNIGDKRDASGKNLPDKHHSAIGQLADRFSHIFNQQEDRKEVFGAIASDSQIELLYRKDSISLQMLVKLVTAPQEILGYIPPTAEQHIIESSIPNFTFTSIIRRRSSNRGSFIALGINDNGEMAIVKSSTNTNDREYYIIQELASFKIEFIPKVYFHGTFKMVKLF
ncbi:2456_t:CDS:2 [Paraglomus occultum]|uniref:2456_t:CDS:1 n=1 Tax=Paraglomus occultum TaxID=144539 RepID=A0A9N9A441_9GLOM|nr:2456_t:CDS:2 [Paraglomus occultum]